MAAQQLRQAPIVAEAAAGRNTVAPETAQVVAQKLRQEGLVFEIGFTYILVHFKNIGIAVARNLFQSFRPLLILFGTGQILKAAFFLMGAPLWFSFYSVWIFEVGYGLFQCVLSFLFISFFYNNLSFARVRPQLNRMFQQQREKI